jgi:hypothetical protein
MPRKMCVCVRERKKEKEIKKEREKVSDVVWKTLKMTLILKENERDDSDEDVFFTPPNSPIDLKPTIIEPTLLALHRHYTPSKSKRLNLHEKIVKELIDLQLFGSPARQCIHGSEQCLVLALTGSRCKLSKSTTVIGPKVLKKTMSPGNQASSLSHNVC